MIDDKIEKLQVDDILICKKMLRYNYQMYTINKNYTIKIIYPLLIQISINDYNDDGLFFSLSKEENKGIYIFDYFYTKDELRSLKLNTI